MNKPNKHDVVIQAVKALKRGQFKATAIKVELEAQFGRGSSDSCEYCREGLASCDECDGSEEVECNECSGYGEIDGESCSDCDGTGEVACSCDGGSITCEECSGNWEGNSWGSDRVCQDWILERLAAYGLAERHEDDDHWYPKKPLVYARFYNDGSVDSELTFTLSLKNPEHVFLLPHFIGAFNALGAEIDESFNTEGAGMHMALINSANCSYPTSGRGQQRQFNNFSRSMQLLLPALYFLGSGCERTRPLRYRRPMIGQVSNYGGEKYAAVSYRGGAIEFRIFDTCYDKPEQILDNIVVIKNTMKYWTRRYRNPGLSQIAKQVDFGLDNNDKLERFYVTSQHIDLLNKGLLLLKPAYYTIREVKLQRNFGLTKTAINNRLKQARKEAEIEYREYENRFGWNMVLERQKFIFNLGERYSSSNTPFTPELMSQIEREAESEVERYERENKRSLERYVEERVNQVKNSRVGEYRLSA